MEKHAEQQDKQNEIMDFFNDYAAEQGEDAEDLLDELEAEMAEEDMATDLPVGPVKTGGVRDEVKVEEDDEALLAELNA